MTRPTSSRLAYATKNIAQMQRDTLVEVLYVQRAVRVPRHLSRHGPPTRTRSRNPMIYG